jgi:hypothetical protein
VIGSLIGLCKDLSRALPRFRDELAAVYGKELPSVDGKPVRSYCEFAVVACRDRGLLLECWVTGEEQTRLDSLAYRDRLQRIGERVFSRLDRVRKDWSFHRIDVESLAVRVEHEASLVDTSTPKKQLLPKKTPSLRR